jgi:hypothetical protein
MHLSPRILATLVPLACGVLAACSSLEDSTRDHGAPGSLRAAVFDHYDELVQANDLPPANGAGRADFSATVGVFVRPGMRLDEAAALLKQNGFAVGALPPRPLTGERWQDDSRHTLFAGLRVANLFIGRSDVDCEFAPSALEGDGAATIGSVRCSLLIATL